MQSLKETGSLSLVDPIDMQGDITEQMHFTGGEILRKKLAKVHSLTSPIYSVQIRKKQGTLPFPFNFYKYFET